MKRITGRAVSVLLLAVCLLLGAALFVLRYTSEGRDWALFYSRANAGAGGELTDRNGVVLASFDTVRSAFAEDAATRIACFHVTGDYWNRTGTGALSMYWDDMQDYDILEGTSSSEPKQLRLTIDASLCRAAYRAIGTGRKGAVMMMNYRTGEVLVMVSAPSTDPIDGEAAIQEGTFINRCLSATYTPGSVFKLVTAAAAIETIPQLYDLHFTCEGVYPIGSVDITCSGTHGEESFSQALADSCNASFAQITVRTGYAAMAEHVKAYGFVDRQDLDGIPAIAGHYWEEHPGDAELAWSGIGQSTDLVCPYTLLRFVAAIANDGILCTPRLLMTDDPPVETRLVAAETAGKLKELMRYTARVSYAPSVNFPGVYGLCAKTGTAELGNGTSHAWFTGFLDDPAHPYAFVVLIERGGGGLAQAGVAANTLLQAALSQG